MKIWIGGRYPDYFEAPKLAPKSRYLKEVEVSSPTLRRWRRVIAQYEQVQKRWKEMEEARRVGYAG